MNMQSTKPTRKAKNQAVSYALITFSYLYAGTVLRKPFYAGGVPLLGLLVSGGALLVFSYVCAAYFAGAAFLEKISLNSDISPPCAVFIFYENNTAAAICLQFLSFWTKRLTDVPVFATRG